MRKIYIEKKSIAEIQNANRNSTAYIRTNEQAVNCIAVVYDVV